MNRSHSRLRRAFAGASDGHRAEIALDAFPTTTPETAIKKLGRMLGGGQGDDLNPTWEVLERIAIANPIPILDALCEIAGARWERIPPDAAKTLERLLNCALTIEAEQQVICEAIEQVSKDLAASRAPVRSVRRGRVA